MKRMIAILLAVASFFTLAACSKPGDTESPPAVSPDADSHYPVTITDHAGRDVVIEAEPQRLISCYYITSSLMIALNLDENMVGIEDNPNYRPIYTRSAPHLLELPWVGTAKSLDAERCAALQPDLVVLPLRLKDSAAILENLGIDVLLVNPESQQLLTEMIQMVAVATNREEIADELLTFLSAQEAYLLDACSATDSPSVYLSGNSNFLSTAGDAMYQSDMIRFAGGTNVAAAIPDTYWAEIDYEQLLVWDPDYIILPSSAKYSVEDILNDPNLTACTAVQNKTVFQVPNDAESWDSPVPSSILGAVWLANILHPDKVSDAICSDVMDEYYETFYNFTYTQN